MFSVMLMMFIITHNFMSCIGEGEPAQNTAEESNVLKCLIILIAKRISLGRDVAIYKWQKGEPVLDKAREEAVIEDVSKQFTSLDKTFGEDDRQFFVNIMEATKVIEYAFVSKWSANDPGSKIRSRQVNLTDIRAAISSLQPDIIKRYLELSSFKLSDSCQDQLASSIFHLTGNSMNKFLLNVAVERAFGDFCKKLKVQ